MSRYNLLLTLYLTAAAAFAGPITITYTGQDSGSLNGTAFAGSAFTITQTADTANVASCGGGCFSLDAVTASINIQGLGLFNFTSSSRTFISGNVVGFSRGSASGTDLFDSNPTVALNGWTLQTSIGPVNTTGGLTQWGAPAVTTSGGTLVFADANGVPMTFQAVVGAGSGVPEPASLTMVGAGLAFLGFVTARRRSR